MCMRASVLNGSFARAQSLDRFPARGPAQTPDGAGVWQPAGSDGSRVNSYGVAIALEERAGRLSDSGLDDHHSGIGGCQYGGWSPYPTSQGHFPGPGSEHECICQSSARGLVIVDHAGGDALADRDDHAHVLEHTKDKTASSTMARRKTCGDRRGGTTAGGVDGVAAAVKHFSSHGWLNHCTSHKLGTNAHLESKTGCERSRETWGCRGS